MPATPPELASRANGDQSAIFRTLANPLRRRILSHLQQHREANSTSLARALGESTGTTSYHLRKLAEQGFVEEVPGKSDGRERWWRALPFQIRAPDPAKMAAAEWSAAVEHAKARAEHDIDLYFRVLTQYEGPEGWAQSSRGGFYMTKEELLAFFREYLALQWKYGHAPDDAPDGARPVALRFFAIPDDTALDGDSGELRPTGCHQRACRTSRFVNALAWCAIDMAAVPADAGMHGIRCEAGCVSGVAHRAAGKGVTPVEAVTAAASRPGPAWPGPVGVPPLRGHFRPPITSGP